MAKKKSVRTEESNEQRKLERQVDAMMSVEAPKDSKTPSQPAVPAEDAAGDDKTGSATSGNQQTAPPLPPRLLKTIKDDTQTAEPDSAAADESSGPDDTPSDDNKADNEPDTKVTQPEETPEADAQDTQLPDALEDNETDKAVDDIVASEANTQLAVDDARARRRTAEIEAENRRGLLAVIFTSPWTWLIIIGIAGVAYAWYH
jgi:hypothetical protein